MKNHIIAGALALGLAFSAAAANDTDPNRMLIIDNNDSYKAFNITNVNRVEFATVEGKVAASINLLEYSRNKITAAVTKTPSCQSYLFNIIPGVIAHQLEANPSGAGAYLRQMDSQSYTEDFTNAEVTGMELNYATEYALVTVGVDKYNVDGDVSCAYFTTEAAPIVGDPKVDVKVLGTTAYTIDLQFTPNSDVTKYYFVIGEKGTLAEQYEQFAGMFGYTNIGEMVKAWSGEHSGNETYQYKDLDPNTDYELYVQPTDKNGNFGKLDIIEMSTAKKGGSGEAKVEILISDYGMAEWEDKELPTQVVTFTPNDQTWAYRCNVYLKETYDKQKEEIHADICSEPPMPNMAHWFWFEPFTNEYQINPNTACVAVAAGKNADGVWGAVNVVNFTTPLTAELPAAGNAQKSIRAREVKKNFMRQGFVNFSNKTLRMVER